MDTQEYERRRRALESQLQADLELVRAGHQARLRALEQIWLTSSGDGAAKAEAPTEPPLSETARSETAASETISSETADPKPLRSHRRGDTLNDLRAALPRLPEIFEREDIYRTLGYTPARATLYRALWTLESEGELAFARHSDGGVRAQYRKLPKP